MLPLPMWDTPCTWPGSTMTLEQQLSRFHEPVPCSDDRMGPGAQHDGLLVSMNQQWPCRDLQIRQLDALLNPAHPSPSTIVVYGPTATGKSRILQSYLQTHEISHAVLRCGECITGRHLFERTVACAHEALHTSSTTTENGKNKAEWMGRCENLGALLAQLQLLLEQVSHKFVLVFDGVDEQREAPPTLLPALARLGEYIPNLATVLVVRHPSPYLLHQMGVPHVRFSAYSRDHLIQILARQPPDIFLGQTEDNADYEEEQHEEDKAWLWPRFCAAVWDSLGQSVSRDLISFRKVCHKLWRPFVAPVVAGDFGTRDFSRLMVAQRRLFQDEAALLHSLVAPTASDISSLLTVTKANELPYYGKWLLVTAYLASVNPARMDPILFMKGTDRKRRRRGGGAVGRSAQGHKLPRHLMASSTFTLDRLLAILHSILPYEMRTAIDVYTQVATLSSLRLLVRTGGFGGGDPLEPGAKWRIGPLVSWEYVLSLARGLDFNITGYVTD